ncbi:HNH endonuclease [Desulfatibacillum aliphaticivorans]|uniref:HNH endonuclease n=1 Tax=Desulfatibacillum aliphaticivorans TaxID=218208 RepID=B8FFI4_DESAL|nr:HNH endonuclease [Desulfatibacillum aliphaticivorans]ACL04244.1 HNH endonuclease [Desulfatibacillum aliphaticivorans]
MKILFCNVGWMKHYDGIDGDSIQRGGSYNQKSIGHEVCNFTIVRNHVYGYVQPTGQIKIENLGANKKDDSISNITVVWTAGPDSGGTAVVGWYKEATVFRNRQAIINPTKKQKRNNIKNYWITTLAKNAVLLPINQRNLLIPRAVAGGIGQSNIWYANKPKSQIHVKTVLKLINEGTIEELPDIDLNKSVKEGNPRLIAHLKRERNSGIVKTKKEEVLKRKGCLKCEVCGFDFSSVYGEHGYGFCEVHHLQPLSKADGVVQTKLEDLSIVCSNCHRIIHRSNPMFTIAKLKRILKQNSK